MNCARCNHPQDWHRHDDTDNIPPTDPNCKFRCIGYDCEVGGKPPANPCDCLDFVERCGNSNHGWVARMTCVLPKGHTGNHEDSTKCWWR